MANIHSFWTVEGIDGSGKSSISKFIGEYLTGQGIPNIVVAAYPNDAEAAFMRDAWIHQKIPMPAVLSCILYLRRRVLTEQIIPALLAGQIVISDRWNDTTWVYQHYTQGIPKKLCDQMFDYHLNLPNILVNYDQSKRAWLYQQISQYATIFLDIDAATSKARVEERVTATGGVKDAFESKPDEFFQNLVQNFRIQFQQRSYHEMGPLYTVDATRDLDAVKQSVASLIQHIN
uniref:dTMP kinase n=1 Tax=Burkholderia phage vB_BgluM-SURPRISE13 TaxID=3159457 RepID=A0AAU7PF88_9VIRU